MSTTQYLEQVAHSNLNLNLNLNCTSPPIVYYPGLPIKSRSTKRTSSIVLVTEEIPAAFNREEEICTTNNISNKSLNNNNNNNNNLNSISKSNKSSHHNIINTTTTTTNLLNKNNHCLSDDNNNNNNKGYHTNKVMQTIQRGQFKQRNHNDGHDYNHIISKQISEDNNKNLLNGENEKFYTVTIGPWSIQDQNGNSLSPSSPASVSNDTNPFHPNNFVKTIFMPGGSNPSIAATVDELDTLPDMQELHNYDKHKELGTGTDAHVYEVIDKRNKSHVAMKLTKRKSGRYRTEINLLHALRTCPHVVQLIQVLENHSVYVLILEQAPMTLENLLHDRCCELPMQEKVAKYIISDVLKGTKAIHNLGFVHKDIKPENVLIFADHSKRKLQAKIADFGFATRVKPSNDMLLNIHNKSQTSIDLDKVDNNDFGINSSTNATLPYLLDQLPKWTLNEFTERVADKCGTPGFWAPELVSNSVELKHAFKMDVFSIGVTLYRMLCNELPFGLFESWEVKESKDGTKKLNKMKPNFQVVSWLKTKSPMQNEYNVNKNDGSMNKFKYSYVRKVMPYKLSTDCANLLRSMLRIRPSRRDSIEQCFRYAWIAAKT